MQNNWLLLSLYCKILFIITERNNFTDYKTGVGRLLTTDPGWDGAIWFVGVATSCSGGAGARPAGLWSRHAGLLGHRSDGGGRRRGGGGHSGRGGGGGGADAINTVETRVAVSSVPLS